MFRLRSKSGDESVFRTPEEIRSALLSGFVTPDAQIWDAALKGWVPLLEHPLYQQIAAAPPGRKSSGVKAPPAGTTKAMPPVSPPTTSPTTAKPVQKLVIRRPGEGAAPAAPASPSAPVPPPAPPAPPAKPAEESVPELEMIDVDLSMDDEPLPIEPPAPVAPPPPPPPPPAPPKRPTPPPAPVAEVPPTPPPRISTPRLSTPRVSAPQAEVRPAMAGMESLAGESTGSRKGIVIGAVVVLLAAGGAFFGLRGKLGGDPAAPDSTVTPRVAVVDTTPDTTAVTPPDTTAPAPAAAVDTTPVAAPAPVVAATPDTTPAGPLVAPVTFAPFVERGATVWTARAPTAQGLSIPELESVRLRYLAAQGRALEQFEAGLQASGFSDMFAPSKVSNHDRRSEALDAVDAARAALNDFRRKQAALDFAYRDSLRAALPAGSDDPDLRTFGPLLRENPVQSALTDSLVAELAEVYGTLVRENGNYTIRGRDILFREQPTADRYREQQERLTAQLARIRNRPFADVPPAQAAILRGIGLPR